MVQQVEPDLFADVAGPGGLMVIIAVIFGRGIENQTAPALTDGFSRYSAVKTRNNHYQSSSVTTGLRIHVAPRVRFASSSRLGRRTFLARGVPARTYDRVRLHVRSDASLPAGHGATNEWRRDDVGVSGLRDARPLDDRGETPAPGPVLSGRGTRPEWAWDPS